MKAGDLMTIDGYELNYAYLFNTNKQYSDMKVYYLQHPDSFILEQSGWHARKQSALYTDIFREPKL